MVSISYVSKENLILSKVAIDGLEANSQICFVFGEFDFKPQNPSMWSRLRFYMANFIVLVSSSPHSVGIGSMIFSSFLHFFKMEVMYLKFSSWILIRDMKPSFLKLA